MPLPNLIVAGIVRSGSSSLNHYLSLHHQVFMARQKELHFFGSQFSRGIDWYRSHFEDVDGQAVIGESTPAYIYSKTALQRMAEIVPSARIVVIVRNPVNRAHSHYWMKRVRKVESRLFAEAVEDEIPHMGDLDYRTASGTGYLVGSNYADLLTRLYDYFNPVSVKVVCLEHLTHRPVEVMNTLTGFLEIDAFEDDPRLRQVVNRNLDIRSLWLRRLSWRMPGKLTSLVARMNSRPLDYENQLGEEIRQKLEIVFSPLNRRLEEMTGLDLSAWSSTTANR